MQDASASICITKLIPRAFCGGLCSICSCWGPDGKKDTTIGAFLIEFHSHQPPTQHAACKYQAMPSMLLLSRKVTDLNWLLTQ